MRVSVNLSKTDKNLIHELSKEPLLNKKKILVRSAVALGFSKLVKMVNMVQMANRGYVEQNGNESFIFNSKTVDPEGIFEVMAYYIISRRMGASINNKKIILASKDELCEVIGEALILGIKELPNSIYITHAQLK